MAMLNLFQLRLNLYAMLGAVLATAGKGTSRWQVQRTRDFRLPKLNLFARLEVYLKYSTISALVYGCLQCSAMRPCSSHSTTLPKYITAT